MSLQKHRDQVSCRHFILLLNFALVSSQLQSTAEENSSPSVNDTAKLFEGYYNVLKSNISLSSSLLVSPSQNELEANNTTTNNMLSSVLRENITSIDIQPGHKLKREDTDGDNDSDVDAETETDSDSEEETEEKPEPQAPPRPPPTRPKPLLINSHPILSSSSISSSPGSGPGSNTQNNRQKPNRKKQPTPGPVAESVHPSPTYPPTPAAVVTTVASAKSPLLATHPKKEEQQLFNGQKPNSNLKSQLDDLFTKLNSFPMITMIPSQSLPSSDGGMLQNLHTIKDAYFEVLERLRDFKNNVSKRFEIIETEIIETAKMLNQTMVTQANLPVQPSEKTPTEMDINLMQNVNMKMNEMERRFNITRWVDYCVHYILANNMMEATSTWSKLEMITAPNAHETGEYLRDIVHLVYARNDSNTSPIFPFLRTIHGVEKLPLYDFLINGMKVQDDFDGTEIFYVAQYLKERNAVRSSIYSKIPKAVQYAVSGRNVNFVYNDKRTGRHYLHVRDDQIRRDRLNFYVQASQSYTDSRAAVWSVMFEPVSDTFRIRNSLYGDYIYVNEEGFVETIPANMATTSGMDFNFVWKKNFVMIQSKSYQNDPLVGVRGGGKFPYYFSLMRENQHSPVAEFLVEPDTLLE